MASSKRFLFFTVFALTVLGTHRSHADEDTVQLGEKPDCHCSAQNDRTPKSIPLLNMTANEKGEAPQGIVIQKPSK